MQASRYAGPASAKNVDGASALATDYKAQGRQTAAMIVRILQGADPADMPVEVQESLEISVNPAAAERMGVTLPEAVIERAAKTY